MHSVLLITCWRRGTNTASLPPLQCSLLLITCICRYNTFQMKYQTPALWSRAQVQCSSFLPPSGLPRFMRGSGLRPPHMHTYGWSYHTSYSGPCYSWLTHAQYLFQPESPKQHLHAASLSAIIHLFVSIWWQSCMRKCVRVVPSCPGLNLFQRIKEFTSDIPNSTWKSLTHQLCVFHVSSKEVPPCLLALYLSIAMKLKR